MDVLSLPIPTGKHKVGSISIQLKTRTGWNTIVIIILLRIFDTITTDQYRSYSLEWLQFCGYCFSKFHLTIRLWSLQKEKQKGGGFEPSFPYNNCFLR